MGTKVHCKSYLPGFYSMRDLNEDCSSSSWPVFYGEKTVPNGQYYNGYVPRNLIDSYRGHEKDALKQKILEHEAVFKNQVCELHRLYRIQRDMMEEAKRKESYKYRASMEPAASSSDLQGPRMPSEDTNQKWHMAGFPLLNSNCYGRTSISGAEIVNSPVSCTKGYSPAQPGQSPFQNGFGLKESEVFDSRPSKVRKKLFDLQLPADEYIDDEGEKSLRTGKIGLADLNEPILIEDDFQGPSTENGDRNHNGKANTGYLGVAGEKMHDRDGFLMNSKFENKVRESGQLSSVYEAGLNRLHQGHHPPGIYPSGNFSRELWIGRCQRILESSDKTRDNSNNTPASYPFFNSCFPTSWSHSASSWTNPTNGFPQKVNGLETSLNSAAATTSRHSHRFCHASSSGSKGLEKVHAFDNTAPDCSSNHGFGIFSKGLACADSKHAIDINLNEQDFSVTDGKSKNEDHLSVLPWLKPKNEKVRDLNQVFTPKENADAEKPIRKILGFPIFERGVQENKNVSNERKNGIIDINVACEELIASEESTAERENHKDGAFIRSHIDLNSCISDSEDIPTPCFQRNSTNVKITLEIDLEVPLFPDSEDDSALPSKENEPEGKMFEQAPDDVLRDAAEAIISISLWGPQTKTEIRPSLSESLLWFANEVEKHQDCSDSSEDEEVDDFEAMTLRIPETKEEDYMPKPFVPELPKTEEMVSTSLQTRSRRGPSRRGRQRRDFQRDILPGLTSLSRHEVTEDIQTFGGLMRATGHSWNSGPTRRNGSGRGRKRAVVEVGPVNVVPGAVCSAPLIQQLNTAETGLEDRSLTGWGKTTRRPRRQRLPPAGNPATVALIQ